MRRTWLSGGALAGILAAFCAALPAAAQSPSVEARLDPAIRAGIAEALAAASRDGIPTEPLVLKALEGESKGASPDRVVEVVEGFAARMRRVREVSGASSSEAALVAGAAALLVGATTAELRAIAGRAAPEDPAPTFGALAYLLDRGVPIGVSLELLETLHDGVMGMDGFSSLQRLVEQDVRGGMDPLAAARRRVRQLAATDPESGP